MIHLMCLGFYSKTVIIYAHPVLVGLVYMLVDTLSILEVFVAFSAIIVIVRT